MRKHLEEVLYSILVVEKTLAQNNSSGMVLNKITQLQITKIYVKSVGINVPTLEHFRNIHCCSPCHGVNVTESYRIISYHGLPQHSSAQKRKIWNICEGFVKYRVWRSRSGMYNMSMVCGKMAKPQGAVWVTYMPITAAVRRRVGISDDFNSRFARRRSCLQARDRSCPSLRGP